MSPSSLQQVDLFHGELAPQRATVYVRLLNYSTKAGQRLVGQIRGPFSSRGETLPATHPFADQGPGDSILVRAIVPDPVRWSIDQPALYKVTLQLFERDQLLATEQYSFAFHGYGAHGTKLVRDGHTLVIRAAVQDIALDPQELSPTGWLQQTEELACFVPADAPLPPQADTLGLPLIVTMADAPTRTSDSIRQDLRNLSRNPAIIAAILPDSVGTQAAQEKLPLNWLKGFAITSSADIAIPAWADFALLELSPSLLAEESRAALANRLQAAIQLPAPVMILARHPQLPLEQRRAACDALQRQIAPLGQFAGYIV